jgi:hypothetical protein
LTRAFISEISHTGRKLLEKTVARLSLKEQLVGMAVEKEAQT